MKKIELEIPDVIHNEIKRNKKYLKEMGISINEKSLINIGLWLAVEDYGDAVKGFFGSKMRNTTYNSKTTQSALIAKGVEKYSQPT